MLLCEYHVFNITFLLFHRNPGIEEHILNNTLSGNSDLDVVHYLSQHEGGHLWNMIPYKKIYAMGIEWVVLYFVVLCQFAHIKEIPKITPSIILVLVLYVAPWMERWMQQTGAVDLGKTLKAVVGCLMSVNGGYVPWDFHTCLFLWIPHPEHFRPVGFTCTGINGKVVNDIRA